MIAALDRLSRQLKVYENVDDAKQAAKEERDEKAVVLPTAEQKTQLNREERRFLAQIERKLRG